MLDIEWQVDVAQRCFNTWESEQDTSHSMYHIEVERFFSRHIYSVLEDLREVEAAQLGEFMKRLIQLAESEVGRAYQAATSMR